MDELGVSVWNGVAWLKTKLNDNFLKICILNFVLHVVDHQKIKK
jgi:hypothetical protein